MTLSTSRDHGFDVFTVNATTVMPHIIPRVREPSHKNLRKLQGTYFENRTRIDLKMTSTHYMV